MIGGGTTGPVDAGDWLEVHAAGPGRPGRRGLVLEVLGRAGHERYRVRWDEEHESIFYPAGGVSVVHARAGAVRRRPGGAPARPPGT